MIKNSHMLHSRISNKTTRPISIPCTTEATKFDIKRPSYFWIRLYSKNSIYMRTRTALGIHCQLLIESAIIGPSALKWFYGCFTRWFRPSFISAPTVLLQSCNFLYSLIINRVQGYQFFNFIGKRKKKLVNSRFLV